MMKTLKLISLGVLVALSNIAFAQIGYNRCATHEMEQLAFDENPQLKQEFDHWQEQIRNTAKSTTVDTNQTFIIPVVVHIVHDFGPENVSRAQVLQAIKTLNEDFARANVWTTRINGPFAGIVGRPKFEFRLARKDPSGNCTDGITRTVSALTSVANNNVKALISWPRDRYFNVWVARTVISQSSGNTVGGFAYRPGSAPNPQVDGVIVTYQQFGQVATSNGSGLLSEKTLSHEAGHWFNLAHTWGGTNDPGLASNCSIDDDVTDTPNTVGIDNQSCNVAFSSCGFVANVENIMDYASCPKMFTVGQAERMRTAVLSGAGSRNNLWAPANLILTGVDDTAAAARLVCKPKAVISGSDFQVCANTIFNLTASHFNAPDTGVTYEWIMPGSIFNGSNSRVLQASYPTGGVYDLGLIARNVHGADTVVVRGAVKILSADTAYANPVFEGFENSAFPNVGPPYDKANWIQLEPNVSIKWEYNTTAAIQGTGSLRLRNRNITTAGTVTRIMSPAVNLNGIPSPATLKFNMAYAYRTATDNDQLRVLSTLDCGASTRFRALRSPTSNPSLSTTSGNFVTGTFVPNATQWREENVSLENLRTSGNFRLIFEFTSGGGNNIYIDNLRIDGPGGTYKLTDLEFSNILPNPSNGEFEIQLNALRDTKLSYSITDVAGKELYRENEVMLAVGLNSIRPTIGSKLKSGTYIVRLMNENGLQVHKVIVD